MLRIFVISILFITSLLSNSFESSEKRVNIIELYTSQGCSSCPLADEWLGSLKNNDKLFREFIPLAFHVTYWDFLGWKDIFAKNEFTDKQKNYSKIWKKRSIYTPQFIKNGQEYRKWFSNKSFPKFEDKITGVLKIDVTNEHVKVNFSPINIKRQELFVNIAILGFNYMVDIEAGENKNRILNHDFVVLSFKNHKINLNKIINKEYLIPKYKKDNHEKAIVVYLTNKNNIPIQAIGGYIE